MVKFKMMACDALGIPDSGSGQMRDRINESANMLHAKGSVMGPFLSESPSSWRSKNQG